MNVAFFLNFPYDPETLPREVIHKIETFMEERNLKMSNSVAANIIKNTNFKFLPHVSSAYKKAIIIQNIGFLNVHNSANKTKNLIGPIRNMPLIYGQQIDYEANINCFPNSSILNNKYVGFVPRDEDAGTKDRNLNLDLIYLKESAKSYGSKEAEEKLETLLKSSNQK